MNTADLQKIEHLAHAYVVTGERDRNREEVRSLLETRGFSTKGNPDFYELVVPELLVDVVRNSIIPFASLSPLGERKYIILSFEKANDAAQNALLKVVEESVGRTTFFLCVEVAGHLLGTVRSRCVQIDGTRDTRVRVSVEAEQFFKFSYAERLARAEKLAMTATRTQDRSETRAFLKDLLVYAHEKKFSPETLRDLFNASSYARQQGSSLKTILLHLAVTLPRAL